MRREIERYRQPNLPLVHQAVVGTWREGVARSLDAMSAQNDNERLAREVACRALMGGARRCP